MFVLEAALIPLLQINATGAVPPVAVAVTKPFDKPQVAGVATAPTEGPAVLVTVALAVAVQLFASVTVSV